MLQRLAERQVQQHCWACWQVHWKLCWQLAKVQDWVLARHMQMGRLLRQWLSRCRTRNLCPRVSHLYSLGRLFALGNRAICCAKLYCTRSKRLLFSDHCSSNCLLQAIASTCCRYVWLRHIRCPDCVRIRT